jgi:hypothetical protein
VGAGATIHPTSSLTREPGAAGAFAWFFFVLLFDGIALASALWLTGRAAGRRGRVVAALPRRAGLGGAGRRYRVNRVDRCTAGGATRDLAS